MPKKEIYGLCVERGAEMLPKAMSLMECLPVYLYNKEEDVLVNMPNIEPELNWLDLLGDIGQYGETLVKEYLENTYNALVQKQADRVGYDFRVELQSRLLAIEVKTSTRKGINFCMSINELKKAKELGKAYRIYFVSINKERNDLYIIDNPYKSIFCENEKIFEKLFDLENISIIIDSVRVHVDNPQKFTKIENFDILKKVA